MIREVDGVRLDLYQLGVWLADRNTYALDSIRPTQITEAMAREALADRYDYTGLYLKRPGGLRFPDNPEHARAYKANRERRGPGRPKGNTE